MADRTVQTMDLHGNAYAKVAERVKLFREDWPNSKTETDHKYMEDGSVEFKAWVWKDKAGYMEMLKEVKDIALARGSADADGNSKGTPKDKKEFEKLQTIALGRALANLGYLGSGDIASFEEMEEYYGFKEKQKAHAVQEAILTLESAKDLDELKRAFVATNMMQNPDVVAAKDKRKAELTAAPAAKDEPEAAKPAKPAEKAPEEPKRPRGGKIVEEPPTEPTLALDNEEVTDADS